MHIYTLWLNRSKENKQVLNGGNSHSPQTILGCVWGCDMRVIFAGSERQSIETDSRDKSNRVESRLVSSRLVSCVCQFQSGSDCDEFLCGDDECGRLRWRLRFDDRVAGVGRTLLTVGRNVACNCRCVICRHFRVLIEG